MIYYNIIVVKLQSWCLFLYCRYLVMVNSSLWLQKQSSRRNPKSASISNFEADSSKNLKKSENLAKSIWRRFLLLKIEFCPWVKILNSWFIEGFHQNEKKNVLKEVRLSFFWLISKQHNFRTDKNISKLFKANNDLFIKNIFNRLSPEQSKE